MRSLSALNLADAIVKLVAFATCDEQCMPEKLTEVGHIPLGRWVRGAKRELLTLLQPTHRGVQQHHRLRASQANGIDRVLRCSLSLGLRHQVTQRA